MKLGGKGYVVAWEPEGWPSLLDIRPTPPAEAQLLGSVRDRLDLASEEAESFGEGERDIALTRAAGQLRASA